MSSDIGEQPVAETERSISESTTRRQALKGALGLSTLLATSASARDDKTKEEVLSAEFDANEFSAGGDRGKRRYVSIFENNTLVSGVLDIPAGAIDKQTPHILDEIYVVTKGRGKLTAGGELYEAYPGAVLFVKAGVEHNFLDVEEDLQVVVVFSTADPKGVPFFYSKK